MLQFSGAADYCSCMALNFRTAFLQALEETGQTVGKVARSTGISEAQLKKLKQREAATTNVEDAVKIAHYFGKSLEDFLDGRTSARDFELAALLLQLEPEERRFLLNAAKAQIASRDTSGSR